MDKKAAIFFDRDGVLNKDIGYLYKEQDFIWIDGAMEAIKYCNDHGYLVFVISNQSGIARGYYRESDVEKLHRWMNGDLQFYGAHIDDFFYCPHYEKGAVKKYSIVCDCRKPSPKFINIACEKYRVDKNSSFMVGDRDSDMECAKNAGVKGRLFLGGNLENFVIEMLGENNSI